MAPAPISPARPRPSGGGRARRAAAARPPTKAERAAHSRSPPLCPGLLRPGPPAPLLSGAIRKVSESFAWLHGVFIAPVQTGRTRRPRAGPRLETEERPEHG